MSLFTIEEFEYRGYTIHIHPDEDSPDPRSDFAHLGKMVCWHGRYELGDEQPDESGDEWLTSLARELDPAVDRKIDWWETTGYAQEVGHVEHDMKPQWTGEGTKRDVRVLNAHTKASEHIEKMIKALVTKTLKKHVVMLPLGLLDHSGLSMWCGSGAHMCDPGGWDSGQIGWIYATRTALLKEFNSTCMTRAIVQKAEKLLRSEIEEYDQYLTGDVYGFDTERPDGEETDDSCWGVYGISWVQNMAKESVDADILWRRGQHLKQLKTWIRNKVPLNIRRPLLAV